MAGRWAELAGHCAGRWALACLAPLLALAVAIPLASESPPEDPEFAPGGFRLIQPRFDDQAAWGLLERLLSLGPRSEEAARDRAAGIMAGEAARWGAARVEDHAFDRAGKRGRNVLAEFPGEGPAAGERVAVIGHFDTVPGSLGALDDGTGAALLAGLAPALAGRKLQRTVVLAAVDLEERGLVGTRAWTWREAEADRLPRYRAAISLEMVGWKDGIPVLHTFPTGFRAPPGTRPPGGGLAPRWLAALALAVGRDNGRPLHFGDPVLFPAYHFIFRHFVTPFDSDSGAFAERGVPALFLSDCSFFRFYPCYHQASDTLDQVDRASLAQAGRMLEALVLALASRPSLPRADEGAREAETDYLTAASAVVPGWGLRLATLLAPLPLLLRALRRDVRGAFPLAGALACATVVATAAAPVTAAVVLLPAWLVAPTALTRGRVGRVVGFLLALLPATAMLGVCVQAMRVFRRVVAPTEGGWALAWIGAVSLGLAALACLPRAASRPPGEG